MSTYKDLLCMDTPLHRFLRGVTLCGPILCLALPVFAGGPNLCQEQEDSLFACQLKTKELVAACAIYGPDVTSGHRSIVYRYGAPDHIELTLAGDRGGLRLTTFVDEVTNYDPLEDDQYLRFVHGPFSYVLYTSDAKRFTLRGLAVFRDGKLLKNVSCQPATVEHDASMNDLLALGVRPERDSRQALRFWRKILPKGSAVLAQRPFGALKYKTPPANTR